MAGTNPNFDAAAFKTAIQTAMLMGQPNKVDQQVTFVWEETDTFSPEGPDNDPYDWTQTATAVTSPATTFVQVNSGIEYAQGGIEGDAMGGFDASHITLTILDDDWADVLAANTHGTPSYVLYGGVTFDIDPPGAIPTGLFNVTVYQIHLSART